MVRKGGGERCGSEIKIKYREPRASRIKRAGARRMGARACVWVRVWVCQLSESEGGGRGAAQPPVQSQCGVRPWAGMACGWLAGKVRGARGKIIPGRGGCARNGRVTRGNGRIAVGVVASGRTRFTGASGERTALGRRRPACRVSSTVGEGVPLSRTIHLTPLRSAYVHSARCPLYRCCRRDRRAHNNPAPGRTLYTSSTYIVTVAFRRHLPVCTRTYTERSRHVVVVVVAARRFRCVRSTALSLTVSSPLPTRQIETTERCLSPPSPHRKSVCRFRRPCNHALSSNDRWYVRTCMLSVNVLRDIVPTKTVETRVPPVTIMWRPSVRCPQDVAAGRRRTPPAAVQPAATAPMTRAVRRHP